MKMYDLGLVILVSIVGLCVIVGIGSTFWFGKDNPVKEVAEKVIEEETGVNIDLTPESKEKAA